MQTIATPLDSPWQFAERIPAGRDFFFPQGGEKAWLPAVVPGHVHLDLQRAGVIGDPFFRMQERACQWVDEADWTYRTTFAVDAERLAARGAHGRHFLRFNGLDTLCRVYLNGTPIGTAENFFHAHRFDVTETLRQGENELRIEFDSALRVGRARAAEYTGDGTSERGKSSYFNFAPRAFVRKPQYMFGWDWGPELVSCGVWDTVELITVPVAEIVDWRMEYTFTSENVVDIRLKLTVEKYAPTPLIAGVALYAPGDNTPFAALPDEPGTHTVDLRIRHQRVTRWSPNGSPGEAKRYLLNLRVQTNEDEPETVAHKGVTVGFRTVELIQEPDADGQGAGFLFRINGVDTFIKGANWIPDSTFPGAITERQLRERLTQARDAGFNMLRVWGGGLYESETFYDLCDALGILVWQDFAFACSMYPDDLPDFAENVRAEAVAAVRRIRHRASLALWCGGNENLELAQGRWAGPTQATRFFGDKTIHEILPAVLADEDPRTPYWPNSPYGGEPCTSEDFGDSHYWNVWHSKKPDSDGDWVHYAESTTRFSSEFGFASPCGWDAWETVTAPEDRTPDSPVVRAHDKTRKDYAIYLGFIHKHFPPIETLDDLIYYGQANQALALRFGVEHWRRLKGRCWGTLFWQINDCWPTQSWAVIDSTGEPKLAYFAAKRFYAPRLISLTRDAETVSATRIDDTDAPVSQTITLQIRTFDGETVAETTSDSDTATLAIPANIDRSGVFVHARSNDLESLDLLDEPKHLRPRETGLTISVENGAVTLTTERFAAFIWLRCDGARFSDNGFHLAPGERRTVAVTGAAGGDDALRANLKVRHL